MGTLVIAGPAGATSVTGLQFLRPVFRFKVVREILQPRSVPLPAAAPPCSPIWDLPFARSFLPFSLKASAVRFDQDLSSS